MSFQIVKQVQEKITSNNKDLLLYSLNIINEYLSKEKERGQNALTGISLMLTVIGAVSAVLLFLSEFIFNQTNGDLISVIYVTYLIAILFLLKSIYYAVRTVSVGLHYRLRPDLLIYDIQYKSIEEAIRYEVIWKIWEYQELVPINTQKLFWLNRCRRNFVFSIIFLLILSIFLSLNSGFSFSVHQYFGYGIGILVLFLMFSDFLIDRVGFWRFD